MCVWRGWIIFLIVVNCAVSWDTSCRVLSSCYFSWASSSSAERRHWTQAQSSLCCFPRGFQRHRGWLKKNKKICECVLFSIPPYIFISEKATEKTVLRMSVTALKILFEDQMILSLEIKTSTLIWANIFMLVMVQQNLPLQYLNCKLILLGFVSDVLDSQHVAVMDLHFHLVTKGWQCVLTTLFYRTLGISLLL